MKVCRLARIPVGVLLSCVAVGSASASEDHLGVAHATRWVVLVPRDALPARPELADALQILAASGSRTDRLAIVEYGGDRVVRLPSTLLGRDVAAQVAAGLEAPPGTADGADVAGAIRAGLDAIGPRRDETLDLVWLLAPASGRADVGAEIESAVAAASARDARVHVVAEPQVALDPVYDRIARETRGSVLRRPSHQPLARALFELVAISARADRLPVRGGGFWVDAAAESVLILMAREEGEDPGLIGSDEKVHTLARPQGVAWHRFTHYDVVELDSPLGGLWRIDQPAGLDRADVILRRSPLRLVASIEPAPATLGAPAKVRIRFEENGRPVVSYARLKAMEVDARISSETGDDEPLELSRAQGGWFEASFTPTDPGRHRLDVSAESPEVVRQNRFLFEAERQCFDLSARWTAEQVAVDVQTRPECSDLREVRIRARLDHLDEANEPIVGSWTAFSSGGGGTYAATLDHPGNGTVFIEARAIDGLRARRFSLPRVEAPVEAAGMSWWQLATRLILANLPLSLLPILWLHRRQLHNLEVAPHV